MTSVSQKIIKPKLGLLELAKELRHVSRACQVMGIQEIVSTVLKPDMKQVVKKLYKK